MALIREHIPRFWTSIADKGRFWTENADMFSAQLAGDAISGAYRIAEFSERNQWFARNCTDCTRCPRAEGLGQKLLTSTHSTTLGNLIDDSQIVFQRAS
jgi:hypothetical protein